MNHNVTARIRTSEGSEVTDAAQFTEDEWRLLERFATEAQNLAGNGILSKKGRLAYSLQGDEQGTSFEPVEMPDPDAFRSLLHQMRPFMLKREPTFFPSVRNVLAKQLTQPAFQQYLGLQKVIFGGRRCQTFQFVADGLMINSAETLDLWLNAYEYHRDDDKRAVIETACDDFVPPEFVRASMIYIVLDRARAVLDIGNAIYALQRGQTVIPFPYAERPSRTSLHPTD